MRKDFTSVHISRKDLKIIKRYCQIWRMSVPTFLHVMALSITEKIPNLTERKMEELRSLQDSQYHVKVPMEQEGEPR